MIAPPTHPRSSCAAGRLAICLGVVVAGCVAPPQAFRDTSVPITSTTRFEAARFAGEWGRVASYGAPYTDPACDRVVFVLREGEMAVAPCGRGTATPHEIDPLGRLAPGRGPALWVLWVDDGFRTAVIGTPDGTLGWVLERSGAPSPDRLAAAREVLAFNGYDPERLIYR